MLLFKGVPNQEALEIPIRQSFHVLETAVAFSTNYLKCYEVRWIGRITTVEPSWANNFH
jgi:hypothetical protein